MDWFPAEHSFFQAGLIMMNVLFIMFAREINPGLLLQKSVKGIKGRKSLAVLGKVLFAVVAEGDLGMPLGSFGSTSLSRLLRKRSYPCSSSLPSPLIRLHIGEIYV